MTTIPSISVDRQTPMAGSNASLAPVLARLTESAHGFTPSANLLMRIGEASNPLAGVRFHTGADAASAAHHLQAEAFTIGQHVYFAHGRYNPQSARGLGVIAHELTHVRQQATGVLPFTEIGGGQLEREAQEIAGQVQTRFGIAAGVIIDTLNCHYEIADNSELSAEEHARMEGILQLTLARVRDMLAANGTLGLHVPLLDVQVHLTLDAMSDAQAAEAWATGIVQRLPTGAAPLPAQQPVTIDNLSSRVVITTGRTVDAPGDTATPAQPSLAFAAPPSLAAGSPATWHEPDELSGLAYTHARAVADRVYALMKEDVALTRQRRG